MIHILYFTNTLDRIISEARVLQEQANEVKKKWDMAENHIEYINDQVATLTEWTQNIKDNIFNCHEKLTQSDQNTKSARAVLKNLERRLDEIVEHITRAEPDIQRAEEQKEKFSDQ